MFDLLKQACESAKKAGCQFADARYLAISKQIVYSRDMALQNCIENEDNGFGVRVLYKGAWGFSSSPLYKAAEVERIVAEAIAERDAVPDHQNSQALTPKCSQTPDLLFRK